MAEIFTYAIAFIVTYFGVRAFVGWSRRGALLDIPNERSSHTQPTPRGGGAMIVLVSLSFYLFFSLYVTENFRTEYFVGAILIAAVSWLDDLKSIWFVWRILIHALSAFLIVLMLNQSPTIYSFGFDSALIKTAVFCAAFIWLVWMTNAYNFMDGIDGIAGVQALSAGAGWMIVGKIYNLECTEIYGGVLAFSGFGFLLLNWQPAKIFMGDVGSAFLGFSFAAMPFLAAREGSGNFENLFAAGFAFVWVFFFDTVVTLLRRIWKRENFWQAHRSHIYQKLVENGFSHNRIAVLYGVLSALNAVLAIVALTEKRFGLALLVVLFAEAAGLLILKKKSAPARSES